MNQTVVTELTVDSRGAETGSATYIAAMKKARDARMALLDVEEKARIAQERQTIVLTGGTASITAQGRALERLRAAVDPVFSAKQKLERAAVTLDAAFKRGIVTETEVAAILDQVQMKYMGVGQAANQAAQQVENASRRMVMGMSAIGKTANDSAVATQRMISGMGSASAGASLAGPGGANAKLSSHELANVSYQLNDIAVMTASGQAPFMMLMQQGMQLSQILGPRGLRGALSAIGTGIVQFLTNPVNLAVAGFAAAAGAASLFFSNVKTGAAATEEALKTHEELIGRIKEQYGKAKDAAHEYMRESRGSVRLDLQNDVKALQAQFDAMMRDLPMDNRPGAAFGFGPRALAPFADIIREFKDGLAAGEPNAIRLRDRIREMAASLPLDSDFRKSANAIDTMVLPAAQVQAKLMQAKDALAGIEGNATAAARALGNLTGIGIERRGDADVYERGAASLRLMALNRSHAIDMREVGARSPAEQASIAYDRMLASMDASVPAAERLLRAEQARQLVLAQTNYSMADASKERIRAANDNVAAAQLELDVLGKSVGDAERMRLEFELISEAKRAAVDAGVLISDREVKALKEAAAQAALLKMNLAEAQLRSDLKFELEQLFRSPIEQEVASRLRPIYGEDISSASAQALAGQIRLTAVLRDNRDMAREFFSSFLSDIRNGTDALKALENALGRIFDRFLDQALDMGSNWLFSALGSTNPAGAVGSAGGGNWLSSLFGSLFGGWKAGGGPLDPGKWYIAGERGPEPIWGGGTGAYAMGYPTAQRSGNTHVTVGVTVDQTGNLQAYVKDVAQRESAAATGTALQSYDQGMPSRVSGVLASGQADQAMGARFGAGPRRRSVAIG
ncbi:MAG: phage tail length tape measure family protein [Bradyrhizobium sp.]|uniref:phage tail length tape measure family protein n=1 Tax=Bradyrhizobium sp. TaxID=376 RepID=UPI003D0D4445